MRIQGISQYANLYSPYPVKEIPVVSSEEVRRQDEQRTAADSSALTAPVEPLQEQPERKASKSADLQNISLTFRSGDDYSYIGKESSIDNLDVMKAVSDMQKDSVLQQYQTFVGSDDTMFSSEDGVVIRK